MATYDAGIVTAYGAAVRGGYTGTYEQFCAQQANYAASAAAVEQAKQDAQVAAQAAAQSAASLVIDDTLTHAGQAADAKKTGDEISSLKEDYDDIDDRVTALEGGGSGSGVTEGIKTAMLQIASKVAYIDEHGQDYYDALYNALYPPADLVSISCVYTQSGTVYDTDSLDSLKSDLVVTAHMSDSTSQTVTTYTLSGTLVEGTSVVTVAYGGKTATFNVTVVHAELPVGYTKYDYITQNLEFGSNAKAYGINTNAQIKTEYTIEAKVYLPSGLGSEANATGILGTRVGAGGSKEIGLFYTYDTGKVGYWYDGTDTRTVLYMPKDHINTIKVQPVGESQAYPNNATINVNGVDYNTESTSTGKTFSPWFGLLAYSISSTSTSTTSFGYQGLRLGEVTVYDSDNEIVYDFVPAKDVNDRCGFYEKINGAFFYNTTHATTGYICGYWE